MFRVNYYAEKFGFVGWECFTSRDQTIMNECVKIALSQMSRMLEEDVRAQIIEI
jgi:hypothetical protein